MPLGAADSAGGTVPHVQRVLLEGEFCACCALWVPPVHRTGPPGRRHHDVRPRGGRRAVRRRYGSGRGETADAGRGDGHDQRPEDLRRGRDPRGRRRPAGVRGPVRDVRGRRRHPPDVLRRSAQPDPAGRPVPGDPWSGTSLGTNKDAGRIRWILQNSYPQVNDLAALARRAGTSGLTEQDAAAGTQVAIWRYSDGAKVDAVDPQAEKLADYLEKSARSVAASRGPRSAWIRPPSPAGRATCSDR